MTPGHAVESRQAIPHHAQARPDLRPRSATERPCFTGLGPGQEFLAPGLCNLTGSHWCTNNSYDRYIILIELKRPSNCSIHEACSEKDCGARCRPVYKRDTPVVSQIKPDLQARGKQNKAEISALACSPLPEYLHGIAFHRLPLMHDSRSHTGNLPLLD
ncbi:hypothetical protein PoB_006160800 [Plakobranchus ocellatus]|uniref:Uncharacterized protein n=1 Tax=Plakobranchus ocellatus TaxID=259542 RepID=A0AAV4CTB0_9GAST|nr:hypothetical protein PoB_006160800 [Plakobranchus ocellatus]